MTTPHTSCRKHKRVRVRLKGVGWIEDRFVERTGKFVVLEQHGRVRGRAITAFQIVKA